MRQQLCDSDKRRIAEAVRETCALAAIDAFEHAAISGLCFEGALECAVGAIRSIDIETVLQRFPGDQVISLPP